MDELVCKIGDTPQKDGYKDGDIIEAFTEKRTLVSHAETILNPWDADKNDSGFLDINSHSHKMYSKTKQYRFEYVVDKVFRYNQFENDKQEDVTSQIDIKKFIARRIFTFCRPGRNGLPMFGTRILPVWFGGKTNWDKLDDVWNDIETHVGKLKEDHKKWGLTSNELKLFMALPCTGLTEEKAAAYKEPMYQDPSAENLVITKKRKHSIPRDNLPLISAPTYDSVLDVSVEVDLRKHTPYNPTDIVVEKK